MSSPKKKFILKGSPMVLSPSFKDQLNEEQIPIVLHDKGPALVIAGAGSGKTRALTYRVAHLIENKHPADGIILITFTRKAADEMSKRVQILVGNKSKGIQTGTFHHLANLVLHQYAPIIKFQNNFSILDEGDKHSLMKLLYGQNVPKDAKTRYPSAETLCDIQSKRINLATSLDLILTKYFPQFISVENEISLILDRFQEKKREQNTMDFDDLMVYFLMFLQNDTGSKSYRSSIKHVLVDEYQDVNAIQAKIVDELGVSAKSLLVVGDDAQAIYAWRGSDFTHMLEFPKHYPNCAEYRLEMNYRSYPQILKLANASINHNHRQFKKSLKSHRMDGEKPVVYACDDIFQQYEFLCQIILTHRDEGIPLNQQAILFRTQNTIPILEKNLIQYNIPYEMRAGIKFFEQAHIKDLLAYLAIIVNPTDEVQWHRVLNTHKGVSDKGAEKIFQTFHPPENYLEQFIHVDLSVLLKGKNFRKEGVDSLTQLQNMFRQLVLDSVSQHIQPPEKLPPIPTLIEEITHYLEPYIREKFADKNLDERLRDFQELIGISAEYQDISYFLGEVSVSFQLNGESIEKGNQTEEEKPLVLSTVHQAKGLEWQVVYVINLVDGFFPSGRAIGNLDEIEEERRLFYVACTRAKDNLYLTYPSMVMDYSGNNIKQRSRFLTEIESENVFDEGELSED